jgi:pre-mycofactocin synthase
MRDIRGRILTVDDARYFAERRLPKGMSTFLGSGAERDTTLNGNLAAFEAVGFLPRAAVQFQKRDTSTTVLGHRINLPVMIAPTGQIRMFHPGGEVAAARAAGAAGTIHIVSCFTGYPIEEITAAATGPVFFNFYFAGGRANAREMLRRAGNAGCAALVVTVDWAAARQKERAITQRVDMPAVPSAKAMMRYGPQVLRRPRWLWDYVRDGMRVDTPMWIKDDGRAASLWETSATVAAEAPTWEDLPWLRELWKGPIILKGITRVGDARRAIDEGVDAIIVSNHGGMSLDGTPPTLRLLPEIVDAVDDRLEIYLDGGVRRGSDVVKALALGARACLIGRAYIWGLAAAGEAGVRRVLQVLGSGVDLTMGSLGIGALSELDPSYVTLPESWAVPLTSPEPHASRQPAQPSHT